LYLIDQGRDREAMADKERSASNLELIGGRLCLDFANTVSTRLEGGREYLTNYVELVTWSRGAGVLTGDEAGALLHQAMGSAELAAAALERAIDMRETIYRIFSAVAADQEPEGGDLAALNAALREALSHVEVVPARGRFEWGWMPDGDDLDRMLCVADRPIGGGYPDLRGLGAGARVRAPGLRLAIRGYQQEPQPSLVQHGYVWQPGQVKALLPAGEKGQ
jgi:predicted RNA-binding Zn ribbon-like protein